MHTFLMLDHENLVFLIFVGWLCCFEMMIKYFDVEPGSLKHCKYMNFEKYCKHG